MNYNFVLYKYECKMTNDNTTITNYPYACEHAFNALAHAINLSTLNSRSTYGNCNWIMRKITHIDDGFIHWLEYRLSLVYNSFTSIRLDNKRLRSVVLSKLPLVVIHLTISFLSIVQCVFARREMFQYIQYSTFVSIHVSIGYDVMYLCIIYARVLCSLSVFVYGIPLLF